MSSFRGRSNQRDGDVDQKFATVEIPRPGLSLSLLLIKGYSIIMPRGEGFPAHNESCVIAFVSSFGCNTDGSHFSNSDISPPFIITARSSAWSHPGPPRPTSLSPRLSCSECSRAKQDDEQISITFQHGEGREGFAAWRVKEFH